MNRIRGKQILRYGALLGLLFILSACLERFSPGPLERTEGQSDFMTSRSNGIYGGFSEDANSAGVEPTQRGEDEAGEVREIEEADIVKIVGNHLFVLNSYRGLQIIDISQKDQPRYVGRAPIFGRPLEMYVRDGNAYIMVSDYYTYWRCGNGSADGFHGSQLKVVDVRNVTAPQVLATFNIEGEVIDSRAVGDVLYIVSSQRPWWYWDGSEDIEDRTSILSVNIRNPRAPYKVDEVHFPRNGWDHHIHATPDAIFVGAAGSSENPSWRYETNVQYVDIGNLQGEIKLGAQFTVQGRIMDRWNMNVYRDTFRIVTANSSGNTTNWLRTFRIESPNRITPLATLTIPVQERLTATQFQGDRAYLVTFRNIDPLWVVDVSDPAQPIMGGILHMPGWLDHIEPRGDRLVALGHDDDRKLAVSLFDVADLNNPKLLSRVPVGERWGYVPAERDDFQKVFKVLDELELVLLPFTSYGRDSAGYWRRMGGVQIINYTRNGLVKKGLINHSGFVRRALPHAGRVLTVSNENFQVMNIDDRDNPALMAKIELARNVTQFKVIGGYGVELAGDWYEGNTRLLAVPLSDPDTPDPIGSFEISAPYGRLFVNGAMAYLVARNPDNTKTRIRVLDLTDPRSPVLRGEMDLPEFTGNHYYWHYWDNDVVQVKGSTLVFHRPTYYRCSHPYDGMTPEERAAYCGKIYVVDLSNPGRPVLASTVPLSNTDWSYGLKAQGDMVYLTSYRWVENAENRHTHVRYYLNRIDLANPARPVQLPTVNIPGFFLGADDNSPFIYTLEQSWDTTTYQPHTKLYTLALLGNRAYLRGQLDLPAYLYDVRIKNQIGYAVSHYYHCYYCEGQDSSRSASLFTLDLREARSPHIEQTQPLPSSYGYLMGMQGGLVFVAIGYHGLLTYDVTAPLAPVFHKYSRTNGYPYEIVVHGLHGYLPSGYYGVQKLQLLTPPPM